jgi:hypothetical protein
MLLEETSDSDLDVHIEMHSPNYPWAQEGYKYLKACWEQHIKPNIYGVRALVVRISSSNDGNLLLEAIGCGHSPQLRVLCFMASDWGGLIMQLNSGLCLSNLHIYHHSLEKVG